jgi:hypothetical protein
MSALRSSPFQKELRRICDEAIEDGTVPISFRAVLEHLIGKLTNVAVRKADTAGFGDFTTVFKPDLFTNAFFDQQSLILKDLPTLSLA